MRSRLLLVPLILLVGGYYVSSSSDQPPTAARSTAARSHLSAPVPNSGPIIPSVSPIQPPSPGSASHTDAQPDPIHPYSDTDVDGDVTLDDSGHFVPDQQALLLFDYFFIETGRLDQTEIHQQIRAWLGSRLQEPALLEALAFLDQYLRLRQLAARAAPSMPDDPQERLELIRELQEQAFGSELAAALFAKQHLRQVTRLAQMQDMLNGTQPDDPTAGMSEAERRVFRRHEAVLAIDTIADNAETPEQLWQQYSEAYGYDAAYRLTELHQQRRQWAERLATYRRAVQGITNDADLDEEEALERTQALLAEQFNPTEQLRVKALERIASSQSQ